MRLALPLGLALLGTVSLVVACTGGPGSIDQGGENGDQYGGVRQDTGGSRVASGQSSSGNAGGDDDDDEARPTPPPATTTPPKDIKASDYSQSCDVDSDCQAVYQGAVCQPCQCPNSAIAAKDAVKYATEVGTARGSCPPTSGAGPACAPCANAPARCDASKKCVTP